MKPRFCTDSDAYLGEGIQAGRDAAEGAGRMTEAGIFGPGSELAEQGECMAAHSGALSWIDSPVYEVLVIFLFFLFCFLIYAYRRNFGLLMKTLLQRTPIEKVYGEQTLAFKYFLRTTQFFAALLVAGIVIRLASFFGLPIGASPSPFWQINLAVPTVLLAIAFIAGYRVAAIQLIAGVTQNETFFSRYRFMTRMFSTLVSLLLAPFFLLCALYEGIVIRIVIYLLIGLCGAVILAYLKLSSQFFMQRKVSILQWILYLCAVEFFPLSFLWFLWMRHMA